MNLLRRRRWLGLGGSKVLFEDNFSGGNLDLSKWTPTDTENKLSVSGGNLVCAGGMDTPAWGDPRIMAVTDYLVTAGLCLETVITPTVADQWGDFGFFSITNPSADTHRFDVRFNDDATISVWDADEPFPGAEPGLMPYVGGTTYWLRILCTAAGRNYYYSLDGVDWYLIWSTSTSSTERVYLGYVNHALPWSSSWCRLSRRAVPDDAVDDTFTRANSAESLGSDSTGKAWAAVVGTWGISSNKAYSVTDGSLDIATIPAGVKDGIWEVIVSGTLASATDYRVPCLIFRYVDVQNFLAVYMWDGVLYLVKIDAGALSGLGVAVATTLDGTDYQLKVIAARNEITVLIDNVAALWYTLAGGDTKYIAYTTAGLMLLQGGSPATAGRWDDFRVQGEGRGGSDYKARVLATRPANLIGYWSLDEAAGAVASDHSGNEHNGAYTGVTLGQAGIGDGRTAPWFDGSNDFVDIYSAGLVSAFDGQEGTIVLWHKVNSAAVWTDGVARRLFRLVVNGSNVISITKDVGANNLTAAYVAGGTAKAYTHTFSSAAWFAVGLVWSKTAGTAIMYVNGVAVQTLTEVGTWVGAPASIVIGAADTVPTLVAHGWEAHAALYSTVLSPAEMASLARVQ